MRSDHLFSTNDSLYDLTRAPPLPTPHPPPHIATFWNWVLRLGINNFFACHVCHSLHAGDSHASRIASKTAEVGAIIFITFCRFE